jgi:UDP-N-acetylmuramyl pentapeptide phosphotransferase/UDP-N-acetylglucosamine-1-phosphate transferase
MEFPLPSEIFWRALALIVGGFLSGWALTGIVTSRLRARAILDHPGERSSHAVPTPRGGGWGFVVPTLLASAMLLSLRSAPLLVAVAGGATLLAIVCWWDDWRNARGAHVPITLRLAVQIVAVATVLIIIPADARLFDETMPLLVERALIAFAWAWLINLFNFMDGIDGLAASEAGAVGIGALLIGVLLATTGTTMAAVQAMPLLVLLGALVGFLLWNAPPAKVFMGDVGSIFLGFLLGFFLLQLAFAGAWAAALILPLAFVGDASMTLLRRALRGEKVWRAHREHAYQRAVQRGESHGAVVLQFAAVNAGLVALAVTSLLYPWPSLAAALLMTIGFLLWLGRAKR